MSQKTVRVRIAVAVNSKGEWNSCGWSDAVNDKELRSVVLDCFDPAEAEAVHFVEAEIPLPASQTVPGLLPDELCRSAAAIADQYPHVAKLMKAQAKGAVPDPSDVAWACSFEIAAKYMTAIAERVGLPGDASWPDIFANIRPVPAA